MRKNLNYYKGKNVSKHIIFFIVFALIVNFVTVFALSEHGSGSECFQFDLDTNEFPVTSVTINGYEWNKSDEHRYYSNENKFTIVVIAGKKGEDYPWISTSGGLDDYKKYTAIDNPDDDPGVEGDEYLLTLVLDNVQYEGCNSMGMSIEAGPFPVYDIQDATSDITITISGDELEYHYVADKPDEPDVSRFKFSINEKHSDALVPFTFGNANYTYNDNPAPNNVTSVTTINPIHYTYKYDGTGFVSFFVNAAASDEYTKIEINGVDYSNQAPHTQSEVFEHLEGRASQFEIKNVPYNASGYNVVVEGRRLPDEKQVGSFGWSYKRESEPSYDPNEDSIFAHGRLEFVQVKYTDIDNVSHVFASVSEYNNARFHGTGEIYQWKDGNKDYQDLANAWGEALVPYGAELTFRIVPDEGYQLVGLANGSDYFEATNEVGVYKVTFNTEAMGKGASNFHLGAVFTEVGNEVKTDSNKIRNGNININQNVENGNLKLEINDTNVSGESRTEFENRAASDGYTVENYLDLSLYNSIYKGGKVDQNGNYESWDTPIENINSNANVTLELSDNMEGKEVAVIHEVHDGNNIVGYDLLETSYNSSDNTISFETNSFSNYAIVVKDLNNDNNNNNNNNPQEMVTVSFNTTGGSTIAPIDVQKGDLVLDLKIQ